jgi:RNA polymerase sigma-70 factor (ECF subfamily)
VAHGCKKIICNQIEVRDSIYKEDFTLASDIAQIVPDTSDEELVRRIYEGETALFEIIMRRYNRRLFRISRSILKNDEEAEDVVQDAYVRAYSQLNQYSGKSRFCTWLTKIAVYESLARFRRRKRFREIDETIVNEKKIMGTTQDHQNPENVFLRRRLAEVLEGAIDSLPLKYRTVFIFRDVEGLTTEETAECVGISSEAVKTRLHRARAALRKTITAHAGETLGHIFPFDGVRCDRIVHAVMERIQNPQ